ncbi:MAG: sulfotransferase [Pseudomonadota bacterium]
MSALSEVGEALARHEGVRRLGRRAINAGHVLRHAAGLRDRDLARLTWLLVATMPNSGSTALAALLATAPNAETLTPNGEGIWLLPSISDPPAAWDPSLPRSMLPLRLAWTHKAARTRPGPAVIVEKSPQNLSRFRRVVDALDGMEVRCLRLYRDPYAVCASWARRYNAARLAGDADERAALFGKLGRQYAGRLRLLDDLDDLSRLDLRYEDVVADPSGTAARLMDAVPELGPVDPAARLKVKDYPDQPLIDMNARQIGALTEADLAAITAALAPVAGQLEARGYGLRAPVAEGAP